MAKSSLVQKRRVPLHVLALLKTKAQTPHPNPKRFGFGVWVWGLGLGLGFGACLEFGVGVWALVSSKGKARNGALRFLNQTTFGH